MGLLVHLLQPANHPGRQGGQSFVLVDAAGPFEPTPDAPGLRLVKRHIMGAEYVHAEPTEPAPPGLGGYVASGTYIITSDGRLERAAGHPYPVPLHNRTEIIERG